MPLLQCERPVTIPNKFGVQGRCRKCTPCVQHRQLEWKNRLILEQHGRDFRPFFTTFTFRPEAYQDSPRYVMRQTQLLFKRLRRRGHDIRYFMAIERGEKRSRLHNHMIIWSRSLALAGEVDATKEFYNLWKNGYVHNERLRSFGGIDYTIKYILKGLVDNIENGESKPVRNFTWSNRPRMGDPGLQRWYYLIRESHKWRPYSINNLPLNWFYTTFNSKQEKVYIPKQPYVDFCKSELGIEFYPDLTRDPTQLENSIEELIKTWHVDVGTETDIAIPTAIREQ